MKKVIVVLSFMVVGLSGRAYGDIQCTQQDPKWEITVSFDDAQAYLTAYRENVPIYKNFPVNGSGSVFQSAGGTVTLWADRGIFDVNNTRYNYHVTGLNCVEL